MEGALQLMLFQPHLQAGTPPTTAVPIQPGLGHEGQKEQKALAKTEEPTRRTSCVSARALPALLHLQQSF